MQRGADGNAEPEPERSSMLKENILMVTESPLTAARLIALPSCIDDRGSLAFIEGKRQIPFDIRRVYYLYDVPFTAERGAHAHKALQQFMIAAHGRFDVVLSDGSAERRFTLENPSYGLYVPRMLWRVLENFTAGAFCLVLASEYYDESDYIRDFDGFVRSRG